MWIFRSTHKHIGQDTLNEYLGGRLQGRPLERVDQQLGDCDACRRSLEELQATVAMLQALPMEAPRRSFVMSAPPPEPARARPNIALRAPNWVYAGAASVAALALAVTISVDATGGLSSDILVRDAATTASAPAGAFGPPSEPGPMVEAAAEAELAARFGTGDSSEATATSGASESESAPTAMAAAAPVAAPGTATEDQSAQGESGGGVANLETVPLAPPAPEIALAAEATAAPVVAAPSAPQEEEAALAKSADTDSESPEAASDDGSDRGPAGPGGVRTPPSFEPAEPDQFDKIADGDTSVWWRVFEAVAGVLAVVFLAGLFFRWRAGRRDSA